jgi:hypothetical protein
MSLRDHAARAMVRSNAVSTSAPTRSVKPNVLLRLNVAPSSPTVVSVRRSVAPLSWCTRQLNTAKRVPAIAIRPRGDEAGDEMR